MIFGELISAGACEFLAKTELGEIHGTWLGNDDAPPGTLVKISIPKKTIRVSEDVPEENFFKISAAKKFLEIDVPAEFSKEKIGVPAGEEAELFVWFFPEDVRAFPR